MNRREKQNRIDTLKRLLKETEAITPDDCGSDEAPHPRWRPGYDEKYYFIRREGDIDNFTWTNDDYDKRMSAAANVYWSEGDAEFALERRKVLSEMDEWTGEYGDPVSIAYYENDGKVESIAALYPNRGEAVFATYEDAEGCIRAIGQERLKKYYFRVSEDEDDGKGSE